MSDKAARAIRWSGLLAAVCLLAGCDGQRTNAAAPSAPLWEEFSGENALRHVQKLVDCGPRPPESDALEKARVYLTEQLEGCGWRVTRQTFKASTPQGEKTFVNLLATFAPEGTEAAPVFLLGSHYDTKWYATIQFVGANDGGSSNGLLLEIARVFARQPDRARQLQLVFFDGEEAYVSFTESDGLYGSRHFARELAAKGAVRQFRGGIVFDMVGDRALTITLPPDSPSQMVLDLFAAAEKLNFRRHFTYSDYDIMDDHTPLNAIGIPTVDLIDFDFPAWHTPNDTMEQISAESLEIVGKVATRYLQESALK